MIRLRHKLFIYALRVLDQGILIGSLGASIALRGESGIERIGQILQGHYRVYVPASLVVLSLGWMFLYNALVHYETNRLKSLRSQVLDVLKASTAAAFLLALAGALLSLRRIDLQTIVTFWTLTASLCILSRLVIRWILMGVRRSGYNYRHVLILGFNDEALRMARRIDANRVLGYKIVGFIAEEPRPANAPTDAPHPIIGSTKDLQTILEDTPADEIILCVPFFQHVPLVAEAIRLAEEIGIVVRFFPDPAGARVLSHLHIERFEGDAVVTLFREQMLMQLLGKRVMDMILSALGLLFLSPLLIGVAIAVKLSSPGPVFFAQERVGMNKRRFKLLKFRSMYADAEKRKRELEHLNEMDGPVFKIKNDPRVTPVGRFIRKTSIDELPQLVNVLKGEMSLVGPRPPLPTEVDRYEWLYRRRLSIKPGITCFWQIGGRNEVSFAEWMELDKKYIDNWSLWLDVKILALTVPAVLFRKGAS